MKVGISQLVAPREWSMEQFLKEAKNAGYEAVELVCRDDGDLTPDTPKEKLEQIRSTAAGLGIALSSMCHSHSSGKSNLLAADEKQKFGIERTAKAVQAAAVLGIPWTLHTLGSFNADLYYDEAYKNGKKALKTLAKTCEKVNVGIAIEFVWNGFLFSPMEMKRFCDDVGSPKVGFFFDPGNMAVFQFPQHWVRIVGQHVKRVHMKDWKGRALNGTWTPLLQGEVNFAAVMAELRKVGYDDALLSEVPASLAPLPDTAAAIRKIMAM